MREFLSSLIMPLSILWLLIILTIILFILNIKRAGKIFLSISLLWFLVISTRFIPDFLANSLESQYSPLNISNDIITNNQTYIAVLGAGFSNDVNLPPNDRLTGSSLFRLTEGVRLHKLIAGSILVVTGNSDGYEENQADLMAKAAISLGVNTSCIKKITTAKNTSDEAFGFYSTFGYKSPLIVVTDAVHMPRAIILFRKAGLDPVAAPTNHLIKDSPHKWLSGFIPASDNISKMEIVIHEFAGLILIRFRKMSKTNYSQF
jgi:uncharacterized SAM-binding protein YcdF (DUF218 family)